MPMMMMPMPMPMPMMSKTKIHNGKIAAKTKKTRRSGRSILLYQTRTSKMEENPKIMPFHIVESMETHEITLVYNENGHEATIPWTKENKKMLSIILKTDPP